jgi:dipeptidyl aminopeptidase/acylaminoacyl peptidase
VLRLLLLLSLSFFTIGIVSAQDTAPTWTLTSVETLSELLGDDYESTEFVYLSPDGSALAWQARDSGLAVYTFADQESTYYPWPETFRRLGRYSMPSWSPDAAYFAFNESVFDFALESDLWLLDRGTGEIINRTDDGLEGGWFDFENPFSLDYMPIWNPATSDLYFFRSTRLDEGDKTELYLLPVERDEPKLAADLTDDVLVLSIYRPGVISPDGTRMALISLGSDLNNDKNGLWLLDLKTGDIEQIATIDDLRTGLPDWQGEETGLFPEFISWAGDDAVVVQSRDYQFATGISQMAHYVDLTTQAVTPITSFADIENNSDLYVDDDPESPILRIPRAGVVTPDGGSFLFLRHDANRQYAGISAVSLPPDGSAPVAIGDIEDFELGREATAPPVMSTDGKALLYGYLLQFELES